MRHGLTCVGLVVGVMLAAVSSGTNVVDAAEGPVVSTAALANDGIQEDFPAVCLDRGGTPWVVYVEYDGKADLLKAARKTAGGFEAAGTLAGPGVIHQPAIACDGKGAVWAIWSQVNEKQVMDLHARSIVDGKIQAETVSLADSPRGDVFAHAATDKSGRVWVTWQSFRNGAGDIYAKYYDPQDDKWSDDVRVTSDEAGDWEPRLAFATQDRAAIVFDSSRNDNFDVFLATVELDGKVELAQLTGSPSYEARATIAAAPDGKGYWVAWEHGRERWGKDLRGGGAGAGVAKGLNQEKNIDVAYYDVASGKLTARSQVRSIVAPLLAAGAAQAAAKPAPRKQPPKKPKRPGRTALQAVNMPELVVDNAGNPWLTCRYCNGVLWNIALLRYDAKGNTWSKPVSLAHSSFGQDRRSSAVRGAGDRLVFAWPSDRRTTKRALFSGVYLAEVDTKAAPAGANAPPAAKAARPPEPTDLFGADTPERARSDRHVWTVDGKEYGLYWGDFHRHTDVSNCATPRDGCIVEQFRYAYDLARLDLLGTSDHTDYGKPYDPYEWWCNQKLADVFYSPGFFTSFYVYEREQRWPWGHRNVIFIERGGPMIYIKRELYKSMPWHKTLPVADGDAEISPKELWQLLRKNGMDVSIISHTGATGMGTDWDLYGEIDNAVENLVEIYQGCRVSYEGIGTPQPTVGLVRGRMAKPEAGRDFGRYNKGVYQNCLKNGYKLGVFANSDHISTHVTFGGVYTESFTRKGILAALNARRTIGATDKIFMDFSCNGHPLGEVFETADKPTLHLAVEGTAPLKAVTIVRNESDVRRFTPKDTNKFDATFTDEEPIAGENRYYMRVEQVDGNMGWTSPVWVTYKKE